MVGPFLNWYKSVYYALQWINIFCPALLPSTKSLTRVTFEANCHLFHAKFQKTGEDLQ